MEKIVIHVLGACTITVVITITICFVVCMAYWTMQHVAG